MMTKYECMEEGPMKKISNDKNEQMKVCKTQVHPESKRWIQNTTRLNTMHTYQARNSVDQKWKQRWKSSHYYGNQVLIRYSKTDAHDEILKTQGIKSSLRTVKIHVQTKWETLKGNILCKKHKVIPP